MTITDIVALAVPPSLDATCAAEAPAGAAEAFAALLDGAAGATGKADEPSPVRAEEDATDDQFDELAALAMTSLLSIGVAVPPTPTDDVASGDDVSASEIVEQAASADIDLTSRAVLVDVSMSSLTTTIGNDMGANASDELSRIVAAVNGAPQTQDTPETTRESASADENPTADAVATPQAAPKGAAATPLNEAAIADVDVREGVTSVSTAKVDADGTPGSKTARSSKPSRSEHANAPHKVDQLSANAAPVSSPANAGQAIEAARASAPTQQAADVRPSGSTAARFARALERAAAPANGEATSSAASTANANGGGSGQPSGFGDSTPDLAAQFSAASRQSVPNVMAFTVNGPVPIDTRAIATAVAAATGQVDNAPVAIPERDLIAQLVQSLRVQFRDGIGEAVLKLKPEHLGSVQISLRVENGAIKATVQAEAPAVRQWLESQQDTLRTGLAEQGLRLERFVVEPDGERRPTEDAHQREREQRRRQHQRPMSEKDQPLFEVTV